MNVVGDGSERVPVATSRHRWLSSVAGLSTSKLSHFLLV